jgi:hypothetical protein
LTHTLTHFYLLPDQMILLVLLLFFQTLDSHSNSFISIAWPNDFTSLTVILPHTWLTLTHLNLLPDQMILLVLLLFFPTLESHSNSFIFFPDQMTSLVLLLIFPTLDSHSNSFVSTARPNDFTSLSLNLPHFWLSL